jgi:hypothetical protein
VTPVGGSYYAHLGTGLTDHAGPLLPPVPEAELQAWLRDRKYRHGIRFVVLNQLGRPESGVTAGEARLPRVLGDLAGREPA